MGVLCLEERRRWFAAMLLVRLGHGDQLDAALGQLGARPEPIDAVDLELRARVYDRFADGSFDKVVAAWRLNVKPVVKELVKLATAPSRDTAVDPVLSHQETPLLYHGMRRLFVGFAHNLLLESLVSRLSNIEKVHPGMNSTLLHHVFMHKGRQAGVRKKRLEAALRATSGVTRSSKARAAEGKALAGSANRSKAQLKLLARQTEAAANKHSDAALFKRGAEGTRRKVLAQRTAHADARSSLVDTKVRSLASTCAGNRRAKPLSAATCQRLIAKAPPAGAKVKKLRKNLQKDQARIGGEKKIIAAERKQLRAAKEQQQRQRPRARTGKGERRAADPPRPRVAKRPADAGPSSAAPPAKLSRPTPRGAAVAASAAAAAAAAADDDESETGDESADEEDAGGQITEEESDDEYEREEDTDM